MSIIYDALQKTQKHREHQIENPTPQFKSDHNKLSIKLILICVSALIVGTGFYLFSQIHFSSSATAVKKQVNAQLQPEPTVITAISADKKVTLQGIFTSNQQKIAMINNQMYHVGDAIDEMKIIAISEKTVKLQKGKDIQLLTVGL